MKDKPMQGLGGKAATEVVYGDADMGCNMDMLKVFEIVSEFVDDNCAYGFETFERSNSPSGYLLERKDRMIAAEVERLYKEAKKIIIENRGLLDALTDALMEQKRSPTGIFRQSEAV